MIARPEPLGGTGSASFHVDGIPKAQPRPRAFARRFGDKFQARVYDAGTAEGWKSCVAAASLPHRPASPLTGPVALVVEFLLPRPKNRCRRADNPGLVHCTTKPDIENLVKAVMDAMTQCGWWVDDSQVVELEASKCWHEIGGRPGAVIRVRDLAAVGAGVRT